MNVQRSIAAFFIVLLAGGISGCKIPSITQGSELPPLPSSYNGDTTSANSAAVKWNEFFIDPYLKALIDTALHNNFELKSTLQEIEIARNEVRARNGLLYPMISGHGGIGVDKVGRYTSEGAGNASTDMTPGKLVPEPLPDFMFGFQSTWEVDIWSKLHTAKKAALTRFFASREGRNFVLTNLIAEIARSYYELLAFDLQLGIIRESIRLQQNELEVVKVQKQAAVATELGVKQFEAQVYNAQSLEFEILQQQKETENRINALLGRFPQPILRDSTAFSSSLPKAVAAGIPSQLLQYRPDVRQSELEVAAAKLEVRVARAEFLPSFGMVAGIGFRAFKPSYLFTLPESLLYTLAGELTAPLINRAGIVAEFKKANALQLQALYHYQQTVINSYLEVATELSNLQNLQGLYAAKVKEVGTLNNSIDIARDLFKSARANYLEVLIAQRDALSAKLELVEAKKRQYFTMINLYKSLGGGWQ